MTEHEDLLARADSAIRGDGVYLARVARVLIDDLRAAVAAANQRADIAEENVGHAENDVDIVQAERDAAYSVIRRLRDGWAEMDEWDWSNAEADAIRRALVADQPATREDTT